MQKLNYYILQKLIYAILLSTAVITSVIVLQKSLSFIDLVINRGLSLSSLLYVVSINLGNIWARTLPFILLITLVTTLNSLINTKELIIFKTIGLSDFKLLKIIMPLGVIISIISAGLFFYIIPKSSALFIEFRHNISNSYNVKLIEPKKFIEINNDSSLYVEDISSNNFYKIILKTRNNNQNLVVVAKQGKVDIKDNKLVFLMQDVILKTTEQNNIVFFDLNTYIFDLNTTKQTNQIFRYSSAESLYLNEIISGDIFYLKGVDKNSDVYIKAIQEIKKDLVERISFSLLPLFVVIYVIFIFSISLFNRSGSKKAVFASISGVVIIQIILTVCFAQEGFIISLFPISLMILSSIIMIYIIINTPKLSTLSKIKYLN